MMFVLAIICTCFGIVVGLFVNKLNDVEREIETTRHEVAEQLSVNEIYFTQLKAWADAHGIDLPEKEGTEDERTEGSDLR